MKQLIVLYLILAQVFYGYAQENEIWSAEAIIGYSVINANGFSVDTEVNGVMVGKVEHRVNRPTIGVSGQYFLNPKLSIGGEVTYAYLYYWTVNELGYSASCEYARIRILPVANFYLLSTEKSMGKLDLYGALGLGYHYANFILKDNFGIIADQELAGLFEFPLATKAALGLKYTTPFNLFVKGEVSIGGPLLQLRLGYAFNK